MTLNNAKSFLEEQEAEERTKNEARAIKAAKVTVVRGFNS